MIRIVQHRMGALIGETESADVESMAEALALEWVNRWTTHPGFFRWSLSWEDAGKPGPRGPLPVRLMAELHGGPTTGRKLGHDHARRPSRGG